MEPCAPSEACWNALADAFGEPGSSPCTVGWFDLLLSEDGMVDSFAEARPGAVDRFTCW